MRFLPAFYYTQNPDKTGKKEMFTSVGQELVPRSLSLTSTLAAQFLSWPLFLPSFLSAQNLSNVGEKKMSKIGGQALVPRSLSLTSALAVQFLSCMLFLPFLLSSQNLDKVGKKEMFTIGGGLNYNAVFYDASGMEARRDPFTWYFNGNVNVTILDVSLPFTFSYMNHEGHYTQPFNMQACHPKYKWAQAHIGTTSLSFSPYTLNGHIFTGAGLELTPNGFYFGLMYGRLQKAVEANTLGNSFEGMSFKRIGYAGKIGYEGEGKSLTISYFSAEDDKNSLSFVPAEANLFPQQNTAIGFSGKWNFLKCISAEGEFGVSGLTRNTNSEPITTSFKGWEKWMLPTKTTTEFFRAWKASLTFTGKIISVSLKHEHVDPDFVTLGAYYFTNDLENWTLAPAIKLFAGKLSIGLNSGIQKNNLDQTKLNTMHRWVGAVNLSASPFTWMNIALSYSNFTSYTNRRPQTDPFWHPLPTDTLSFYQLSQQANGNLVFTFGSKKIHQAIAVIGSYQQSSQQQGIILVAPIAVVNGNLSWSLQFTEQKISITVLANYNQTQADTLLTQFVGPGLQAGISRNGFRFSAGTTYNRSYSNEMLTSHILSHRGQISYSPKLKEKKYGQPSLSVNVNYVTRFAVRANENDTGELTATFNLAYAF